MCMFVLVFQHALWVSYFMPLTSFQVSREKHKLQVGKIERRNEIYGRNTEKCVCAQHVCVYVCASGIRAARAELVWWWLIFVTTRTCWHRMAQQFPPAQPATQPNSARLTLWEAEGSTFLSVSRDHRQIGPQQLSQESAPSKTKVHTPAYS